MIKIDSLVKKSLLGLATSAMLVGGAAPVLAESSSCFASVVKFGNDACTTGSVAANAGGHFIHVSVTGVAHWEVYDSTNFVTVAAGQTGVFGLSRTLFQVYARYKLELHAYAAQGSINNT